MKSRITKIFIFALIAIMLFGTLISSAYESYETYTYSIDGEPLQSPAAYTPDVSVYDSKHMGIADFTGKANDKLGAATDIVTDKDGNFYIADKDGKRVIILDKYTYKVKAIIDGYTDEYQKEQTFVSPQGVFITNPNKMVDNSEEIYICDTEASRIVVLDINYNYLRTISVPEDAAAGETTTSLITKKDFKPTAVAVDIYGRIFVVSM